MSTEAAGRVVHGPKFPGPVCPGPLILWPGPLIKVICKARPVQARSIAGLAHTCVVITIIAMHYANLKTA